MIAMTSGSTSVVESTIWKDGVRTHGSEAFSTFAALIIPTTTAQIAIDPATSGLWRSRQGFPNGRWVVTALRTREGGGREGHDGREHHSDADGDLERLEAVGEVHDVWCGLEPSTSGLRGSRVDQRPMD